MFPGIIRFRIAMDKYALNYPLLAPHHLLQCGIGTTAIEKARLRVTEYLGGIGIKTWTSHQLFNLGSLF
jgi:hypothetical protein